MNPVVLSFSNFYKNLVPQDALMFINLLARNGTYDSLVYPRLAGFSTIPVAFAEAASYAVYAPIKGCYKLFTGDIKGAAETFRQNGLSSLQCLALTVGSVVYAFFGFIYGQEFYVLCLPQTDLTDSLSSVHIPASHPPVDIPTVIPQKILNDNPSTDLTDANFKSSPPVIPSKQEMPGEPEISYQPEVYHTRTQFEVLCRAKAPAVERSQAAQYYKYGAACDRSTPGLWRNTKPQIVPAYGIALLPIEIAEIHQHLNEAKYLLANNEACASDIRMRKFKINEAVRKALAFIQKKPNSPQKEDVPHSPIGQPGFFQWGLGLGWQAVAGTANVVKHTYKYCSDGYASWKDERYQTAFRWLQKALVFEDENVLPCKLVHQINAFCAQWMTSLDMTRFHYEAAMEVASKVNPLIRELMADRDVKFSQKIDAVHTAIAKAKPKDKAQKVDLLGGKAYQLLWKFDHLSYSNMPSKIMSTRHVNDQGKILETVHFRVGVPVHSTENREFSLVPEYRAFLNHLKTLHLQGKPQKLLTILHLNPELYLPEGKIQLPSIPHLPTMEAQWIKLMIDLSKTDEYKDILSVALIPLDGAWLHEIVKSTDKTIEEIEQLLVKEITKEKSFYILPRVEDKKKFVQELVNHLHKAYFPDFDYSNQELDETQKRAFIGLFNAILSEALQILNEANYVQHNCKDAADRTGAQTGLELCEKSFRLGCLNDLRIQAQIIGLTDGTCLGIMKRPILDENRFDFFSAGAHRLVLCQALNCGLDCAKAPGLQPKLIQPFGGYRLQHMDLGWESDQCLKSPDPKQVSPPLVPIPSYS